MQSIENSPLLVQACSWRTLHKSFAFCINVALQGSLASRDGSIMQVDSFIDH